MNRKLTGRCPAPFILVVFAFACGGEDVSPPESHSPSVQSKGGERVEPVLVHSTSPAQATPDEMVARWSDRATAIGVFHCAEGKPFLSNPSDPSSITTRFTIDTRLAIKGKPPTSVVQAGGRIGDLQIESVRDGQIRVGGDYLGFFEGTGTGAMFAAVKITKDAFRVRGHLYTLASLQASLGGQR